MEGFFGPKGGQRQAMTAQTPPGPLMRVAAGASGFNAKRHLHFPSAFKAQRQRHGGALAERLGQANQHDMQPTGAEMHCLTRRDRDIRHRAHAHDIAFADMGMKFHDPRGGAGGGDQPIPGRAIILERHEARAIGIGAGGAGPGMADGDITCRDIMVGEGRGGEGQDQGTKGAAGQVGHGYFLLIK